MNHESLGPPRDPNLADYAYAAKPLVNAYAIDETGKKSKAATLLMGEWAKILDKPVPQKGLVHVRYRGGEGHVKVEELSRSRFLEVFLIDVDQGDSILIQTPDDRRVLIDGGQGAQALEFISNKYRLDKRDNYVDFEAVVATHSDADHTQGLIKILKHPKIAVKRFYHNGLFRRKDRSSDPGPVQGGRVFGLEDNPGVPGTPELTSLMKRIVEAAQTAGASLPGVVAKMNRLPRWNGRVDLPRGGFVFKRLDAHDRYVPPFTDANRYLTIEVLWPRARQVGVQPSYTWYNSVSETVNGNSVVLSVRCGRYKVLLTGDLNASSMQDVLKTYAGADARRGAAAVVGADVYKAAHHGSQDFDVDFLKAVRPDAAVISSGDDRNDVYGHPRAVLVGTITRYSRTDQPAVFSTELAACFTRLSKDELKGFRGNKGQLYERSIEGVVHLRSDGERLLLGTVHGRRQPEDPRANVVWKWDIWPQV